MSIIGEHYEQQIYDLNEQILIKDEIIRQLEDKLERGCELMARGVVLNKNMEDGIDRINTIAQGDWCIEWETKQVFQCLENHSDEDYFISTTGERFYTNVDPFQVYKILTH